MVGGTNAIGLNAMEAFLPRLLVNETSFRLASWKLAPPRIRRQAGSLPHLGSPTRLLIAQPVLTRTTRLNR